MAILTLESRLPPAISATFVQSTVTLRHLIVGPIEPYGSSSRLQDDSSSCPSCCVIYMMADCNREMEQLPMTMMRPPTKRQPKTVDGAPSPVMEQS